MVVGFREWAMQARTFVEIMANSCLGREVVEWMRNNEGGTHQSVHFPRSLFYLDRGGNCV